MVIVITKCSKRYWYFIFAAVNKNNNNVSSSVKLDHKGKKSVWGECLFTLQLQRRVSKISSSSLHSPQAGD